MPSIFGFRGVSAGGKDACRIVRFGVIAAWIEVADRDFLTVAIDRHYLRADADIQLEGGFQSFRGLDE